MAKLSCSISNCSFRHNIDQGYMALMTVIIISALLAGLTTSLAARSILGQTNQLANELKTQSRQLAAGCASEAMLSYAFDHNYQGNQTIMIDDQSCRIESISTIDQARIQIISSAQVGDHLTTLQTLIRTSDLLLVSQSEITN